MTGAVRPHVQRQRLATPVFAGLVASCAALLAGGLMPGLDPWVKVALLAVAALLLLVLVEFERLTVVVTESELIAGFRIFRSRTPLGQIADARPMHVRLFRHGIGVHLTLGGALAFTARTGPGVEIVRKGRMRLVVSCDDPEALVSALGGQPAPGATAPGSPEGAT